MKKDLQTFLPFALVVMFGISQGVSVLSAQGSENLEDEIIDLEDFEVQASPIIASQQSSIELQREAVGVVNVAASDYVGRFPDQNAAAALSRFPAVAVQRDQGQARFVQVRGAPARWTTLAFDNIDVVGADGRISRFDAVPAVIIDKLEVHKTLTSDMPAESIAGRVNVVTDSGLGHNETTVDAEVGLGFLELGDGMQQRASVRLLTGGDKWGLSAAASHYGMNQVTDNREYKWSTSGVQTEMIAQNYVVERQNNAGYIKLEYMPDARTILSFSSIYTEFKDSEQRNRINFVAKKAIEPLSQTSVSGELVGVPMTTYMQDGQESNSTWANTLAGKHGLGGEWYLSWRLNYTETAHSYELPLVIRLQNEDAPPTSFDYLSGSPPDTPVFSLFDTDYRPDVGIIAKGPPRDAVNQKAYGTDVFAPVVRFTESDAIVVAADLDKAWSTGDIPSLFKVGFQVDSRNIAGYLDAGYNYVNGLNHIASANGVNWDPDSYLSDKKWDSDFPLGFDVYYYDYEGFNDHLFRVLGELEAVGAYDPSQDQLETNHYNLSEDILSVFAMNSWTFENSTFVAGLRMESVALKNHGFPGVGGSVDAIDQDQDYTNLFPSLHYNVDLKENLKLRVAGVSGISRPGFSQIRLGVGIDDNQKIVHIGNPELVAETAYGFDLSLEWYFKTAALLSVGAYYRQVDDVLYDFSAEVGDDRFDLDGKDRSGYEYRITLNGSTGHLSGLELSYMQRWPGLPGFLDGLGMQFSTALMDGEFEGPNGRKVRFPGTSDMLVNASLFYENFGFSLRLSYQWRDSWVDDLNWESESDIFWGAYDQLDFSLRYQLNRSVSFFFDANNLTESRTIRYKGEREFPVEVEGFGSRYMFGVRGGF